MKLKSIVIKNNRGNSPDYDDNDLNRDFPIINQSCVQKGFINFDKLKYNKKSNEGAKGRLLKGDVLICSTGGGTAGRVGYWDYDYVNYIADSHVTVLRVNNKNNSRYLYYYLSSIKGTAYIRSCIKGATNQEELSNKALNNFELDMPNLDIQIKLANFLDQNCSKIDNEVSLLQKKSILLDEYKNALIYETVTKGLDKNAEMKDSGIEWMGCVPIHWNIRRVKNILTNLNKSSFASGDADDGEYNFYVSGKKIKKISKFNLDKTAILLPTGGTFITHFNDNERCSYSTDVLALLLKNKNCNLKFYYYLFSSSESFFNEELFYGSGLKHLNRKGLFSTIVPVPLLKEQNNIVNYLDIETKKIEKEIELINKKVELLKEYKQSLIYEAVTGQLEIE